MKIKELIDQLKKLDGSLDVYVSGDSEGNQFSPLHQLSTECMTRKGRSFEAGEGATNAIVIWPSH